MSRAKLLTGNCRLMEKVYLMHLFCPPTSKVKELDFTKLHILTATTAANIGLSTNFYNMVQGMGHCDRNGRLEIGEKRFEIHI